MSEENLSQKFRLKNIHETKFYWIEVINRNELMSKKHKNVFATLNYIQYLLILASTITGCALILGFDSLVDISAGYTSSAIGLQHCAITAEIKKYLSIIKKKKKHYKIVSLAKSKWNNIKVLNSRALIHSVISDDEFVLINNLLK